MVSTLHAAISDSKTRLLAGHQDFSMEYLSLAGRRWGGICEWETRLTIRQDGAVELFRRRAPGDSPHRPPGRFHGRIPEAKVVEFLDVLAESGIQEYQSEPPGPLDPVNFLRLNLGGLLFSYSWGASIIPMPESMVRVKRILTDWLLKACPDPKWSLFLRVDKVEFRDGRVQAGLRIENQGSESIHILHPASPGFGPGFGLSLLYGEAQLIQEGFTPDPVEEREAPMAVQTLSRPELIPIPPNAFHGIEFAAALDGEAPRGWVGAFAFHHYLSEDKLAGLTMFNGALFSEDLTW